jgi:hypothetical protein
MWSVSVAVFAYKDGMQSVDDILRLDQTHIKVKLLAVEMNLSSSIQYIIYGEFVKPM